MKISHSIFLSFFTIILLFSLTAFINFRLSKAVTENEEFFSKSTDIIRLSGRFQRNILMEINSFRGYLLTDDKSLLESYDALSRENNSILEELSSLLTDSSQMGLLNEIYFLNGQLTEEYIEPLKQARQHANINPGNRANYDKLYNDITVSGEQKDIQASLLQKLKDFTSSEYDVRNVRKANLFASVSRTKMLTFILTAVSVLMALLVVFFLVRKISNRIGEMTKMADSIANGNYTVAIYDTGKDELGSLVKSLNHMAEELSRNISLLKRSNGELDQFAHIVSHDMKGPLRGIDNVITWIEEDHISELPSPVCEYLKIIKGRIKRAENLIEGLLSYARTGKEKIPKESVDLNKLVQEVFENLPNVRNVHVSTTTLPTIYGERLLLFQLFSNLISNAIKYNDKPQGEVMVYYKEHNDQYEFFVEDNGIGIAQDYLTRIFVIFQTLQDRDSFESAGVGLAIVKKILENKKQSIKVLSTPGKGSIFSFTWPKSNKNDESG